LKILNTNPENDVVSAHDSLVAEVSRLSSATLHEAAGKTGALPSSVKPLAPWMRLCGRALPVKSPPSDNLWIHHAINAAKHGEVLVVDVGDARENGYWGEIMTVAAQIRGIAGLVITGGVRDSLRIIELKFPLFSAAVCIRGTYKDPNGAGSIGDPVQLGNTVVERGDIVFGDADGVVVLPAGRAASIVAESRARDLDEITIIERLRRGESTVDIYGLPDVAPRG
jgi:4-hydroxy-4-methyl-2-oxoglutarate aldolase